ncbi:MAG: class I SAM-dependent methyltransferase [Coriobacteriia bacterium]|nr:class I SAM-dependent methyltransferase [Coriobacteriia bacterium]
MPFLQKKISNREFGIMQGLYRLIDHVHPYIPASVALFGIKPGQTVIDYGCGPGRYTVEFARLVTGSGKVVAVDLVEIALQETQKKLEAGGFENYELVLARDYDSGIADNTADAVFAIDMFHHIADTDAFLQELHRIAKPDALLLFSGGHMLRKTLKKKVDHSGLWKLTEERREFITYKPKEPA